MCGVMRVTSERRFSEVRYSAVWSLSYLFFFFSSRRRHTRCSRDWSSDVCSSDLRIPPRSSSCTPTGTLRCSARGAWVRGRERGRGGGGGGGGRWVAVYEIQKK